MIIIPQTSTGTLTNYSNSSSKSGTPIILSTPLASFQRNSLNLDSGHRVFMLTIQTLACKWRHTSSCCQIFGGDQREPEICLRLVYLATPFWRSKNKKKEKGCDYYTRRKCKLQLSEQVCHCNFYFVVLLIFLVKRFSFRFQFSKSNI